MDIQIYLANLDDIDDMSRLSKAKRLAYEKAQPKFWSYAGEKGDEIQKAWFKELLDNPEYLLFIAKDSNQQCMGFVIGKLMQSPQVYNPGGLTLLIDDFCVATEALWPSVGLQLLKQIKKYSQEKGAIQVIVVCGHHDKLKAKFLNENNLNIVSDWYLGESDDEK